MKLLCKTTPQNNNDYFHNLNLRYLYDNKKFWKTIKPYFSNK